MTSRVSHPAGRFGASLATAIVVLVLPASALAQRGSGLATIGAPAGAAPSGVTVAETGAGGYTNADLLIKWQPLSGATGYSVSRSAAGGPWVTLPAQPSAASSPSYLDAGAIKLVFPKEAISYRVTATYPSTVALGPGVKSPSATSTPVSWTRPEVPMVTGLTASTESGPGDVILKWYGYTGPHVHVYRDGQKITSIPLPPGTNSTGEKKVPSGKHIYHVAPAVEVAGKGWVIFPTSIWAHASVQVEVP